MCVKEDWTQTIGLFNSIESCEQGAGVRCWQGVEREILQLRGVVAGVLERVECSRSFRLV